MTKFKIYVIEPISSNLKIYKLEILYGRFYCFHILYSINKRNFWLKLILRNFIFVSLQS